MRPPWKSIITIKEKMSYTYKNNSFSNIYQLAYFIWCEDNSVVYKEERLSKKEIKKILSFIYKRYGRSGLSKYRDKTEKDFKRKIIDINMSESHNLISYKNKNIKLHYKCKKCSKDVYTAYSTYSRFNDSLCKRCRKKSTATN